MIKLGIIGFPLRHSLSPVFWNLYFKRKNINAFYEKIELSPEKNVDLKNYRGLNITTPWKEKILKYAEIFDEVVMNTKNANTLLIEEKVKAYNTDFYGFAKLMDEIKANFKNIIILGTGGAAKTCAFYFKNKGVKNILFLSRNKKDKIMGCEVKSYKCYEIEEILENADLIINATPCGWKGNLPPLNMDYIKKSFLVDLQYGKETPFLKEGKKRGLEGVDGKEMLLYQAIYAGKIWFSDFDENTFKNCFNKTMEGENA